MNTHENINLPCYHCFHYNIDALTNNAGLSVVQKVRTRDKYHTVDKAIRHKTSTISSADGNYQLRKLKDQWGGRAGEGLSPILFAFNPSGSESEEKGE